MVHFSFLHLKYCIDEHFRYFLHRRKMTNESRIIQPLEYYKKFLDANLRPDGRGLNDVREIILSTGTIETADSSSLVKCGNTSVICGIKAELTSPKPDEPSKGFIIPNVELSPLCDSRFKAGPPSEQAQMYSKFLDNVIKSSKCLDTETLCIKKAKLVWVLHCDLDCICFDGNVLDACVVAMVAALKKLQLPKISIDEKTEKPVQDLNSVFSLCISCIPVSTTFAIFENGVSLSDPTYTEEDLSIDTITVVTIGEQICHIYKRGHSPMVIKRLFKYCEDALTKSRAVRKLINDICVI